MTVAFLLTHCTPFTATGHSPSCKELSLRSLHLLWAQLAGTHFGVSKLEGDEKGNPTFLPGERIKMKRFFLFSSARSSWHLS